MNALVVGPRGALRDGLTALLYPVSRVQIVSATEDISSALELVQDQGQWLVLMQIAASDECGDWIEAIKTKSSDTQILALVSDADLVAPCLAEGIDKVLIQGISMKTLHQTIEELVRSPKKQSAG